MKRRIISILMTFIVLSTTMNVVVPQQVYSGNEDVPPVVVEENMDETNNETIAEDEVITNEEDISAISFEEIDLEYLNEMSENDVKDSVGDNNDTLLIGVADKSIIINISGESVTLTAENYIDGEIYVAFFKNNGELNSVKIYSPDLSIINIDADEDAAYAKVMWFKELQPNCESKKIKLKDEYSITYYVDNNDNYLKSINIENPNPDYYFSQNGLYLQDLIVDGYIFVGWYTAQVGGERVTLIEQGEVGNKTLYAHWEKVEYVIQFASDMVPVDDIIYTTGEEKILPKPILDKYTFVGWSDKEGNMWETIPAGATGNITLYANWASNRNRAVAKTKLDEPIICEDSENGLILFTYEIGEIRNVPLFTTLRLQCANGIISTIEKTDTNQIDSTQATTIAETISNATTNSSSWTLSNDWNASTEVSKSYLDQTGKTKEEAESLAKSESDTYNLSSSSGGSSVSTSSSSGFYKLSGNRSHDETNTNKTEYAVELSTDRKLNAEVSGNVGIGIKEIGDMGISATIGAEMSQHGSEGKTTTFENTGTDGWSLNGEVSETSSNTSTAEKNWNTTQGYSNSTAISRNSTISNVVSKLISEQYGYGESYAEGGSNSNAQEFATSDTKSNEYSSTMTYHTSKIQSKTESFSSTGNTKGGYRMVMAGTVHVFAVVGYDVAKSSYFVYTYNVLDDKTEEYLDYSFDESFNDYETSIIPFEIPYFVNKYVNNRIAKTDGLVLDVDTGKIVDYEPTGDTPDQIVAIPSYINVDNNDGTFKSIKVTGIEPGVFKNNTDIVGVKLGNYITEIPDSLFEGCTSLKYVICPRVRKIGNRAFSGCISLEKFKVPLDVTSLGEYAFNNVPEVEIYPKNSEIAKSAVHAGAVRISIYFKNMENELSDYEIVTPDTTKYFAFYGSGKTFTNVEINSDADETIINQANFNSVNGIPLVINSGKFTLNNSTVTSKGAALVLPNDNTTITLEKNSKLESETGNTLITKNISLKTASGIASKLNVTGKMLVCGDTNFVGKKYISTTDGIIEITLDEFNNNMNMHKVVFETNGGSLITSQMVNFGAKSVKPSDPTKEKYRFVGWYSDSGLTTKWDFDTPITKDTTIYAKWMLNEYFVTFNANGGNGTTTKKVAYNSTVTAPTVTRDYYRLEGWYKDSACTQVWNFENDKVTSDITLYAKWKQNSVSGWVLAANMPSGAAVVSKKWTYTLTSYTTSSSSSLSGWTKYDTKRTSWGSTQGPVYSNPSNGSRNVWSEQYVSSTTTHYKYYHRWNGSGTWSNDSLAPSWARHTCDLTYSLPAYNNFSGVQFYGDFSTYYTCPTCGSQRMWVPDGTYTTNNYSTRWYYQEPVYTYYYKKSENKETTSYPTGDNISNIQEYVQYRLK